MSILRTAMIAVSGGVLVLAGIAMLVLPGPGWATIALGVGVWSKRFAWAARFFRRLREQFDRLVERVANV